MTTISLPGWAGQAAYQRSLQRGRSGTGYGRAGTQTDSGNTGQSFNSDLPGTPISATPQRLGSAAMSSEGGFDDVGGDLPPPADIGGGFTTAPPIGDRFSGYYDAHGSGGWGGGQVYSPIDMNRTPNPSFGDMSLGDLPAQFFGNQIVGGTNRPGAFIGINPDTGRPVYNPNSWSGMGGQGHASSWYGAGGLGVGGGYSSGVGGGYPSWWRQF